MRLSKGQKIAAAIPRTLSMIRIILDWSASASKAPTRTTRRLNKPWHWLDVIAASSMPVI